MGERKRLRRGECEGAVGRKVVTASLCICGSAHLCPTNSHGQQDYFKTDSHYVALAGLMLGT